MPINQYALFLLSDMPPTRLPTTQGTFATSTLQPAQPTFELRTSAALPYTTVVNHGDDTLFATDPATGRPVEIATPVDLSLDLGPQIVSLGRRRCSTTVTRTAKRGCGRWTARRPAPRN